MRVRRARMDDAAALTALAFRSKASHGYDDAFMEACREELRVEEDDLEDGETWLIENGKGVALGFFSLSADGDSAEIAAFFVAPDRHGGGVGRALWRAAEQRLDRLRIRSVHLASDPGAVGFYERMGLTVTGTTPSESIPGRMLPLMQATRETQST